MDDDDIHARITTLVEREHELRGHASPTDEQRQQLDRIEQALDQAWDLLRQREALRESGRDPSEANPRPVSEVEGYLQ